MITRRQAIAMVLLTAVIGVVCVTSLYAALPASPRIARVVWMDIRVPRVVVGLAAGAAMGVGGLLVQRALRNDLAVPELLGVSGGAALASAIAVLTQASGWVSRPVLALVGALFGGGVCILVASRGRSPAQTLLVGAAMSTALQGLVLTVLSCADTLQQHLIFTYLVGSLESVTRDTMWPVLAPVALSLLVVPLMIPALGVLRLGDDAARALGVHPGRWRLLALVAAAALVAAVTAYCGPIAWVSFLAPTLSRLAWPVLDDRWRLLPVALLGAGLTVGADLLAREVFTPVETPLGAWTALLGLVVVAASQMPRLLTGRSRPHAEILVDHPAGRSGVTA